MTSYFLTPDGKVQYVGNEPLDLPLCRVRTRRASHVLPVNRAKRLAFRILRLLFGDRGAIASWTRTWHGPWEVRLVQNRSLRFTHPSRRVCLSWERKQIERAITCN